MTTLFSFLAENRTGLLVLFLTLAGIALLIQWFAWIFRIGRFKPTSGAAKTDSSRTTSLRFLFGDLLVKIIDDFRHLLALIVVLIFAFALGVGMYIGSGSIDNLAKSMQVVVATLGGLVGSIIGYYFGESTVLKQQQDPATATTAAAAATVQQQQVETQGDAEDITPAPLPPPPAAPVDDPDADAESTS